MFTGFAILHFLKLLLFTGTPGLMIVFFLLAIRRIKDQAIPAKAALRIGLLSALKAIIVMLVLCVIVVFLAAKLIRDWD